ncbi:MAG: 2-ketoisovalerate ferredoxin oxidoreductase [Desulfuromonas sp. SDB]|nr:MAG: 2-ketoisovalerate ferredoxin oxidoreductase [Desulfuromonas sp. SDB]
MGKLLQKPKSFYNEFFRSPSPDKLSTHYCPGCGHGVIHKYVAEAMDDFGIADNTIWISPVGCSVFGYYYFDCGHQQVPHGRAPAVATGVKRSHPEAIVISYQGDGDLAAIGGNNIIQAANRGENITVIFVNNSIYGMTGGQMAPTTLVGQTTTTSPYGRNPANEGYPMRMAELIAQLEAPVYVERVALNNAQNRNKTRKAIRKALKIQIDKKGFSLVEILSQCPSGWKVSPVDSLKWMEENQMPYFPLGVFKDVVEQRNPLETKPRIWDKDTIIKMLDLDRQVKEYAKPNPTKDIYEQPKIKVAGFGGQGILMLGVLLSEAAMLNGKQVTWIPSYGPEMRGGTANCQVVIRNNKVGNPSVDKPTILIAMNQPSLDRFEKDVIPGGLIVINETLVTSGVTRDDVDVLAHPFSDIADKQLGTVKVQNSLILGALIKHTNMLDQQAIFDALPAHIKKIDLIPLNKKAIELGFSLG